MPDIAHISSNSGTTNTTSLTVALPGSAVGDVALVYVTCSLHTTCSTPAGWTKIGLNPSGGTSGVAHLYWKVITLGEPNPSFSLGASDATGVVTVFRNVSGYYTLVQNNGTGVSWAPPGAYGPNPGMVAVSFYSLFSAFGVIAPPGTNWGGQCSISAGNTTESNATHVSWAPHTGPGVSPLRYATDDVNASRNWWATTLMLARSNSAPNAATLTTLTGGESVNRAAVQRAAHTFSDADPGETQSKFDLRYRLVGAGTWTTITVTSPSLYYDFPANTFAAGNYERQVLTYDSQGVAATAWSASGLFTMADVPNAPTITAPTNGSTVPTNSATVTWSTPAQQQYQVQVVDSGGTIYHDTGAVVNTSTRSVTVPLPTNSVSRIIKVRTMNSGLWSPYSQVTVSVAYTAPATPTLTVVARDDASLGFAHCHRLTYTHPTPAGAQPVVAYTTVEVRVSGSTTSTELGVRPSPSDHHLVASGVTYEYRVTATGTTGTTASSAWVAAPVLALRGVVLHDPADATTTRNFRLNDDEAEDEMEVEASLVEYEGREFPVVEYGAHTSRVVEVPVIHSRTLDADRLRALVMRRAILCYRDRRGRIIFGLVKTSSIKDTTYGQVTGLQITQTDY